MDKPTTEMLLKSPKCYCTERYIKIHYPEYHQYLWKKYGYTKKFSEKLYRELYHIEEPPKCPVCRNPAPYQNFVDGYSICCSHQCVYHYGERFNKLKQTMLERYGVECSSYDENCKRKRRETTMKHYGVGCSLQSKEVREKGKQTMIKKYGVENASQSSEIKQKKKETCLKNHGVEWSQQSEKIRAKGKQTCLKKYGVKNPSQSETVKEKVKQTCRERYGVEYSSQSETVKEKVKQTFKERYGVEHALQSDIFKEKLKQTCRERYGFDYYNMTQESIDRIRETKRKNHTFNTSKIEQSFKQWLDDNHIPYKYQYCDDKYPFNCDFYFPDKELYFEIQGSWVHGKHPFDPHHESDLKKSEFWKSKNTKYYDNAIDIWTQRDPFKRQYAKDHGVNLVEAFTVKLSDLIEIFKMHYY